MPDGFRTGNFEDPALQALHEREVHIHQHNDVDTWSDLWSDDIVVLAPGQSAAVGKKAALAALRGSTKFGHEGPVIEWSPIWEEVIVGDHLAIEWGCIRSIVAGLADGREAHIYFNVMRVLKRNDAGGWLIHRLCWNEATRATVRG